MRRTLRELDLFSVARGSVLVALALGTVLAAALAIRFVSPTEPRDVFAVAGALVLAAVAVLMPVHWLPAAALVFFGVGASAFVPTAIPLPFPPPVLLIMVWVMRRLLSARRPSDVATPSTFVGSAALVALMLLAWSAISMYLSPLGGSGPAWVLSFASAIVLPMLIPGSQREAEALIRVWVTLGTILGVYALAEVAIGQNFLYWALGRPSSQHWSAYRAEGPFGHPLPFATFLVTAFGLAIGRWLQQGGRGNLIAGVLSLGGVVVTLSRGALIAAVVTFAFAYFVATAKRGVGTGRRLLTLGALAAAGAAVIVLGSPIVDRWTSEEGANSSLARDQVWDVSMQIATDTLGLGTGPGSSSRAAAQAGFSLPIENSLLQLLVSLGVPGLLLFALLAVIATRTALRNGSLAAAAAVVAYVIAIAGYNAIDDRRSSHVLLGLLLLIALNARQPAAAQSDADLRERSTA